MKGIHQFSAKKKKRQIWTILYIEFQLVQRPSKTHDGLKVQKVSLYTNSFNIKIYVS